MFYYIKIDLQYCAIYYHGIFERKQFLYKFLSKINSLVVVALCIFEGNTILRPLAQLEFAAKQKYNNDFLKTNS